MTERALRPRAVSTSYYEAQLASPPSTTFYNGFNLRAGVHTLCVAFGGAGRLEVYMSSRLVIGTLTVVGCCPIALVFHELSCSRREYFLFFLLE